jgi:prepilin-type N-terminal cleavage/methylation domain-containing protein
MHDFIETNAPGKVATSPGRTEMRRNQGLSLIELLIVVAIILIIAPTAIPNLVQSRMAANESSAVGSLGAIKTAEYASFRGLRIGMVLHESLSRH